MTGDPRFLDWARRIGDAYVLEVLPGSFGVPAMTWNFETHTGERRLRLRDHGNETVVGLVMLFTLEQELGTPRADAVPAGAAADARSHPRLGQPDGMLYNEVDPETLAAARHRALGQLGLRLRRALRVLPGDRPEPYREAVRRVLGNLPKYRKHVWEPRREPPARIVRRLRRRDRERDLSGQPRAGRRRVRLDRLRDGRDAVDAAAGRPRRGLVRRGQLQPHRAALRLHEESGRAAGALGARRPGRRGARRRAAACSSSRCRRHAASSSTPRGTAGC